MRPLSIISGPGFLSAPSIRGICRFCVLVVLCLLTACSSKVTFQAALKDTEANEMIALLDRHGIHAQKHANKEGVSLSVDESDLSRATEVLNAAGLPRRNLSDLGKIFKKEGMISTPLEERARYIYGLSAELEYTLQQFDRVISARVHVVLPERVAPGEPIQPSSAAVFIKYRPPLDEDMVVPRVRNLVAASIPGLNTDDRRAKVSVVMLASETEAPGVQWTSVGPFHVQEESADVLRGALVVLGTLALSGVFLLLRLLTRRYPSAATRLNHRGAKVPAAG